MRDIETIREALERDSKAWEVWSPEIQQSDYAPALAALDRLEAWIDLLASQRDTWMAIARAYGAMK